MSSGGGEAVGAAVPVAGCGVNVAGKEKGWGVPVGEIGWFAAGRQAVQSIKRKGTNTAASRRQKYLSGSAILLPIIS